MVDRFVVVYDIADSDRRNKVYKAMKDYGVAVQESVFELHLREEDLLLLKNRLKKVLKTGADSVVFYPLCARCVERVERIGVAQDPFVGNVTII